MTDGLKTARRSLSAALLSATLLAAALPAAGEPPRPPAADYDRAVLEIERHVAERYVEKARAPAVLAALAEGRRSGRYARAESPHAFAILVTEDLRRASQDGHMYIDWAPDRHRSLTEALAAGQSPGDSDALWLERARRENAGLTEQKLLEGNVRYLKVSAFLWVPQSSPAVYVRAMAFLQGGDAVIIDLRGNGGGDPAAVNYLASHFLPPETKLMTFVMAGGEEVSISQKSLPAGRISGKPVYVLIDKGVASAGEEFAQHVEKFRFGELIGETTAGAGNRNEHLPVGPGWALSVSVGLAKHATDGAGWEGVGIRPATAVAPARALDLAQARALERLAQAAGEPRRAEYLWAAEVAKVRAEPVALAPAALARYAGVYGERTVRVEGETLVYQRQGGPELRLTPMGGDRFIAGPRSELSIVFEFAGDRTSAAVVSYADGRRLRYARTG